MPLYRTPSQCVVSKTIEYIEMNASYFISNRSGLAPCGLSCGQWYREMLLPIVIKFTCGLQRITITKYICIDGSLASVPCECEVVY